MTDLQENEIDENFDHNLLLFNEYNIEIENKSKKSRLAIIIGPLVFYLNNDKPGNTLCTTSCNLK